MGGFPKRKPPVNDQEHSVNTASLNVNKHKWWYSPAVILIYFKIFLYSQKAYNFLWEGEFLITPHKRNLRKIIAKIDVDNSNNEKM